MYLHIPTVNVSQITANKSSFWRRLNHSTQNQSGNGQCSEGDSGRLPVVVALRRRPAVVLLSSLPLPEQVRKLLVLQFEFVTLDLGPTQFQLEVPASLGHERQIPLQVNPLGSVGLAKMIVNLEEIENAKWSSFMFGVKSSNTCY